MGDLFKIGEDGALVKVVVAIDLETAIWLALAIFVAIAAALAIYSKLR